MRGSIYERVHAFGNFAMQRLSGGRGAKIVPCPYCGTKNRILQYSLSRDPVCGRCHAALPIPEIIRWVRVGYKYRNYALLVLVIGVVTLAWPLTQQHHAPDPHAAIPRENLSFPPAPKPSYPAVPIRQGVQQVFVAGQRVAPLEIDTPSGSENYYVKLVDASTGAPVMTAYIYGSQTFETTVPTGTYRVRYATGETWYGPDHLFGPQTSYSEATKDFAFTTDASGVNGYTIQLIRQLDGNLHVTSISASNF